MTILEMSMAVTEQVGPPRRIRYRFINEQQADTAAAAKSLIRGRSQFVKPEELGQVSWEWKGRRGRRKNSGSTQRPQKHAVFVSKACRCFENVLRLGLECRIASLGSRSAKGERCARSCQ